MEKLTNAQLELREMDDLAAADSPVHRLNPLCKLLVTVFYIATVVSFPKYDLSGLVIMVLYPVILFQAAGIPVSLCFRKLRLVLPLLPHFGEPADDIRGVGGVLLPLGMALSPAVEAILSRMCAGGYTSVLEIKHELNCL